MTVNYVGIVSSLFNHSCIPNANYLLNDRGVKIISTKDIKEKEEVTIAYIFEYIPKVPRREKLFNVFNFECDCAACLSQIEDQIEQFIIDQFKPLNERLDRVNAFLKAKKYSLVIYYMTQLRQERSK